MDDAGRGRAIFRTAAERVTDAGSSAPAAIAMMADGTAAPSPEDSAQERLLDIARSLIEPFRARAAEAEHRRRIHRETHEELRDAGLYRVQMPARYDGYEMHHRGMLDIAAEIGRGCGSAAWIFSNIAAQNGIVAMASKEVQDEMWGDDRDVCAASSFPARGGTVRRVDGGLIANGIWSFASGVDWAEWNNMQVFVPQENGPPRHHMALVPKSDYTVIDDWFSPGLAATGSRSIALENVFIPDHRTLDTGAAREGRTIEASQNFGPIFRMPPMCGANKIFSGPVIGIARGARDAILRDLTDRTSVGGVPMATLPSAQIRISEAGALIDAAWALLQRDSDVAWEIGRIGRLTTIADRAGWRRNNAYAGVMCVRAVDLLHPLIGARGLVADSDFLRAHRDLHAATMQINMSWDRQAMAAAQLELGLEPSDPRI